MKKLLLFALLAAAALTGCDKLKDATSRDFTVNNVRFEFSAGVEDGPAAPLSAGMAAAVLPGAPDGTRSATRALPADANSFSVTRTVALSEIGSADLVEYKNKIDKVKANSSLLKVTVTPAGGYTVENLKIEAAGVSGSPLTVPALSVGGTFTPPANMNAFTQAFVMKLITAGSVQVTVSGRTDAPDGATLKVSYENDLVFTASLL